MKALTLGAFALATIAATPALAAITLTFKGQSNTIYSAPITRSGFEIGNPTGQEQHFHEIDSTQFGLASNGTGVLLNDRDTDIFLQKAGGGTFTLTSIDVASSLGNNNGSTGITISGYLASVLQGAITISNLTEFQNVVNTSFGTVDYVVFDGNGGLGGFELDNVVLDGAVAAVPESSTWMMMIFGFGLVGATMRRRVSFAKNALV